MLWNLVFVAVTAGVAWHGITWRDDEGESDVVRLLYGCIALIFCLRVLFGEVLGVL